MTETMTTAEATVASLLAHGIDTLYALPGVHNDHLFDALFKASDRIRTVHTRHEQGAAYMALGAALATGQPAGLCGGAGPGLLNTGAALLTAYAMNAPVLGADRADSRCRHRPRHRASARDPRPGRHHRRLVDFSARIRGAGCGLALVAEALRAMATGRRGPAALECAIDVWGRSGPRAARAPRSRRRSRRSTRMRSLRRPQAPRRGEDGR